MSHLRIGYIGNFTKPWCTEVHVRAALESHGRAVIALQENTLDWRTLPAKVDEHGLQLVMWTRTWEVDRAAARDALAALRDMGVPTVSFHLDRFFGLEREYLVDLEPFFHTDLLFTPDDGGWAERGVVHHWMPPGVDDRECDIGRERKDRFPWPIVFVGSHPYPHPGWEPYRSELIATLQRHFGRRFMVLPRPRQPIRGQDLADLYATARVVVGDSCLLGGPARYWSDRIPETLGRGGLLIHPRVEGIDAWYRDQQDLLLYDVGHFEQVVAAVEWALSNTREADRIRHEGQRTVMARDTYKHRMAEVLRVCEDRFGPGRPVTIPPPPPLRVMHKTTRVQATLAVNAGGHVADAVREVWDHDDYAVTAEQVRGGLVIDVGANVGAFSVLAALLGARRVHAFEPHPDTAGVLRSNVAENHVDQRVVVHEAAVWPCGGPDVRVGLQGDGGGVNVTEAITGANAGTFDLDRFLRDCDEPVRLVKVDCEGSEYAIVAALSPEALSKVDRIVMEYHGPGMPHLRHLAPGHAERWGAMLAHLAEHGRVEVVGRPSVGGLLTWSRY